MWKFDRAGSLLEIIQQNLREGRCNEKWLKWQIIPNCINGRVFWGQAQVSILGAAPSGIF